MAFAIINGITMHFQVTEGAGGPALVFSNSLGTDFRIWDELIRALRQSGIENRIVRYDKRGHGLSDAPSQPYKMQDHVDDLDALLRHLGESRVIVHGLSVGGLIAQGLYQKRPEIIKALILSDTAHKIGNDAMWNSRIEAVNQGGIGSISDGILERWFSEPYRSSGNPDFAGYSHMLVRTPADGYAGTSAAIRDADFTEVARSINVPTLLICGSNDGATTPQLMQSTHELISGSVYEIIEGPGHLPNIENPQEVCDLVAPFLKGLSS